MDDLTEGAVLVATIHLYREADGRYIAVGRPEDRDTDHILGRGSTAEKALRLAGKDYDETPPFEHRTVRIED